jgi:hypothetical protein
MRKLIPFFISLLFILPLSPISAQARLDKPYDHSIWDEFLKKFVNDRGEVDYRGIKQNRELLDRYVAQLADFDDPSFLKTWPREEVLAFWLNVYHVAIIKVIVDHYPIKSINDIPDVWNMDVIKVGKASHYNLGSIRKANLMRFFRDEKIHLVLSCGAKSGPKMRNEAFTGPRVEGQMFLAVKEFVNDPSKVEVIPGKRAVRISKVFEWYEEDFLLDFGTWENDRGLSKKQFAVMSFIDHYLTDSEKVRMIEEDKYKVKYLPFDWSLNEWNREAPGNSASPVSS